ncbi:DUF4115 domain-containing protein [Marinicauda salina]|uniref:DUF4115 domain-containing protein n=1 Tax=Marinicauda salina TaxID=2135793 RepID=A0A2U2BS45_9PROT|nr:helix-turn-helix domain-containing protein [Marinicauda salina]PWE16798.1 DUF4115 domain-containing protein [Marinicauda salina]
MTNALSGSTEMGYVPVDAAFADAPPPDSVAASLGERLRQARLKSDLTLDSAAARTRIKRDYLEALETMDPRGLPSRAYAIGYLRTYAAFLGLDTAAIVDQFKQEVECESGRAQPTSPKQRREIKLPRGLIGAVLILGGVIGAASWYGSHVTRTEAFAGAPDPVDAMLSEPRPMVEASAAPEPARIWSALPEPDGGAFVLEATAPALLEVRDASGRILFSREMTPGERYRAPDEPGLTVSTDDAGAISVRAGASLLGAIGEPGETVENISASDFVITALSEVERDG